MALDRLALATRKGLLIIDCAESPRVIRASTAELNRYVLIFVLIVIGAIGIFFQIDQFLGIVTIEINGVPGHQPVAFSGLSRGVIGKT